MSGQQLLEEHGGSIRQPFKRLSPAERLDNLTTTKDPWDDDDDFSITPSFYAEPSRSQTQNPDDNDGDASVASHRVQIDSTYKIIAQPPSTSEPAPEESKFRITKHIKAKDTAYMNKMRQRYRERIKRVEAEASLSQPTDVNNAPSSFTPTASPSDSTNTKTLTQSLSTPDAAPEESISRVRKMGFPPQSKEATVAYMERLQTSYRRELARRNASPGGIDSFHDSYLQETNVRIAMAKEELARQEARGTFDGRGVVARRVVSRRRERSPLLEQPQKERKEEGRDMKEREIEEPTQARSENIKGFLREWLDGPGP